MDIQARPRRIRLSGAVAGVLGLLLGGCALLQGMEPDVQRASAGASPRSTQPAEASQSIAGAASHTPDADASATAMPSAAPASNPEGLPDPPGDLVHEIGEEVAVPGGRIVYLGLSATDQGFVAAFAVVEGSVDDARLVADDGEIVGLSPLGDRLESDAFGRPASPPAPDATLTLVIGDVLVPFEAGRPVG